MAATHVAELPRGPEWSYEIKLDGYRVLALKDGDNVRLLSRKGKDLTRDFPSVVSAVRGVRATTVTLDGEIVAVDDSGVPRFPSIRRVSRSLTSKPYPLRAVVPLLASTRLVGLGLPKPNLGTWSGRCAAPSHELRGHRRGGSA